MFLLTAPQLPRTNHCQMSVFQSGVSPRLTLRVLPGLHPDVEESRPEGQHLPLPDIWWAGIPTGAAPSSLRSHFLHPSPPCLPLPLFCILAHFGLRFIFCCGTFSILSLPLFLSRYLSYIPHAFCPLLFFVPPPPRSLFPRSSSALLFFIHLHCYSYAFHDETLKSLRVPIITTTLRADLNTQCVWWMEATSPH